MWPQWLPPQHQWATRRSISTMEIGRLCDDTWTAVAHVTVTVAAVFVGRIVCAAVAIIITISISIITIHDGPPYGRINGAHSQRPPQQYRRRARLAVAAVAAVASWWPAAAIRAWMITTVVRPPAPSPTVYIHHHPHRYLANSKRTTTRILIKYAKVKVQTVGIPLQYVLSINFSCL